MKKLTPVFLLACGLLAGCASTKGWKYMGPCPVDGYPCRAADDYLLPATAQHPYGGMDMFYECINPDLVFPHTYDVTNWYNKPVHAIPVYKAK